MTDEEKYWPRHHESVELGWKRMVLPGLEPGTFSTSRRRDNRYTIRPPCLLLLHRYSITSLTHLLGNNSFSHTPTPNLSRQHTLLHRQNSSPHSDHLLSLRLRSVSTHTYLYICTHTMDDDSWHINPYFGKHTQFYKLSNSSSPKGNIRRATPLVGLLKYVQFKTKADYRPPSHKRV